MRLSLIASVVLCATAEALLRRVDENNVLTPKDAGPIHTEAFKSLGEIFRTKKPRDELDVMMAVSDVLSTYTQNSHQVVLESFHTFRDGPIDIQYPKSFDPNLKNYVDRTQLIVESLDEKNVDEVVDQLVAIQEDLEKMEEEINIYSNVTKAGVSVAIESTKLWHSAVYDTHHDLHDLVTNGGRKLSHVDFDVPLIIFTDVAGIMAGAFLALDNNATLFFDLDELIRKMIGNSISYSAAAASSMLP